MALDRDLGVAVASACFPLGPAERAGWETNAATGVRGLRLLVESGRFASFRLSEAGDRSFPVLAANCASHPGASAVHEDARRPGGGPDERFDWVDVDPYGTPLPYVGPALQRLRTGGVLAVSATDMMVLAGAPRAAARRLYGAEPVRGRLGPEGGLRILLANVARLAREGGRHVVPLVGYVGDHHVRAYVRISEGTGVADPVGRLGPDDDGPPLGGDVAVGPLWLGPLFDPALLVRMAPPAEAAEGAVLGRLLARFREEATVARPFYYETNRLCASLGVAQPPSLATTLAALRAAGFSASRTHVRPEGFRTDASRPDVERIVRALGGPG